MSLDLCSIGKLSASPGGLPWLWAPYLAAGKLTLLDGDPGCGKSMLTVDLAARLSRAAAWPDGTPSCGPASTLLLNAEDDPADTLLPRLVAAGANLNHVFVPEGSTGNRGIRIPRDLNRIEAWLRDNSIRLLVLDPFAAYLSPALVGGHGWSVRRALAPLAGIAARTGAAILLVRHLRKQNATKAVYRGLGSIGIMGLVRAALLAARHPREPDQYVLSVAKCNLAAAAVSLTYRVTTREGAAALEWLGPSEVTADALCAAPPPAEAAGIILATAWLLEAVAGGPRPAVDLLTAARAAGIAERTLARAKSQLGMTSKLDRQGYGPRVWLWCPPSECDLPSFLAPLPELAPLDFLRRKQLPNDASPEARAVIERDQLDRASRQLRMR